MRINNIIEKINFFFENSFQVKTTFIHNKEYAENITLDRGIVSLFFLYLNNFRFNIYDYFKSIFLQRLSLTNKISTFHINFNGEIKINFINGTAVLIDDCSVYKFYFKDTFFLNQLYIEINNIYNFKIINNDDFFAIKLPKFNKLHNQHVNFTFLCKELNKYHLGLNGRLNIEDFSPENKIKQIAKFHCIIRDKRIVAYLDISRNLQEKYRNMELIFCHGDLWIDNIMRDNENKIHLIDFDKTIYFCKPYDLVYYYLMTFILSKKIDLNHILENIETYCNEIFDFILDFKFDKMKHLQIREIWLSVYLFCFLKISERDFRNKFTKMSAYKLKKILNNYKD